MERAETTTERMPLPSEPQRRSPDTQSATLQRVVPAASTPLGPAAAPPAPPAKAIFAQPTSSFRSAPKAASSTAGKDDTRDEEIDELGSPAPQPRSESDSLSDATSRRGVSADQSALAAWPQGGAARSPESNGSNAGGPRLHSAASASSPPFAPHVAHKAVHSVASSPASSSQDFNFSGTNVRKSCDRCHIKHFKCVREAPGTMQTPCISCVQNGLAESCLIRSANTAPAHRSRTPFGTSVMAHQQPPLPTSLPPTPAPASSIAAHHQQRSEPSEGDSSNSGPERSRISCDRCRSMKTKCVREPPGSLDVPCNSCIKRGLNACVIGFRFTAIAPGTVVPQQSALALPKARPSAPPAYPSVQPTFAPPPPQSAVSQHNAQRHRMSVGAVTDPNSHVSSAYSNSSVYTPASSSNGTYAHPAGHSPAAEAQKRKISDASSDYQGSSLSGLSRLAEVAYKRPRQDTGPSAPAHAPSTTTTSFMSVIEVERIPLAELVQLAHRVTAELGIRSQSKHTRSPGMEAPPYPRSITGSASGLVSAAHGHTLDYPSSSPQAAPHQALRAASPAGSKRSLAVIDALPLQLAISLLEMWDVLVWPVVPLAFMRQSQIVTLLQRLHSPQDHQLSPFDTQRLDVASALLLALHAAQLASALPSQRGIAQGRVYKALFEAAVQRGHPLKSEDAEPWLDAQWVGKRAHEVLRGETEGRVGALKDYVKANLYAIDGTDEPALIKHISRAVVHAAHALILDDTGSSSDMGTFRTDEERAHDADWNALWHSIVLLERSVPAINITGCGSFGMSINMTPSSGVTLSLVQEAQRLQDQRKLSFFDRNCAWRDGPLRAPVAAHAWLTSRTNWILDGADATWSPYARFAARCEFRMLTLESARLELRMRLLRESLGEEADQDLYAVANWRRFTTTLRDDSFGSATGDLGALERMHPQATLFALRHAHHVVGEAWTAAAQAVLEQHLVQTAKRAIEPARSAAAYAERIRDATSAVELFKHHTHAARSRYAERAIAHLDAATYVLQGAHLVVSAPNVAQEQAWPAFLERCLHMLCAFNESNVLERLLLGDLTLETPDVRSLHRHMKPSSAPIDSAVTQAAPTLSPAPTQA